MKLARPEWSTPRPALLLLAAVTLAALLPFIHKPFHIDDPLFIWSARQIQAHPLDFYGFHLNWDGQNTSMSAVAQNPPLGAYYLRVAGGLLGWDETGLHAGFLLPALAFVLGTYFLARNFCGQPLFAAWVVATAPGFVVPATGVMCDTLMSAFWIWAVVFWVDGLRGNDGRRLCASSLLITGACLTKYFGFSLVPLLLVYGLLERRRTGWWMAWLLLPLVFLGCFQWWTHRLYGQGLLSGAVGYAAHVHVGGAWFAKIPVGLAFAGGCNLILLAAAPVLWGMKRVSIGLAMVLLVGGLLLSLGKMGSFPVGRGGGVQWLFIAQMSLFVVVGTTLLVLAWTDMTREKTPASIFLCLWIGGTFLFTTLVNWTVSGRNILPMLPAVALLVTRRLETRGCFRPERGALPLLAPLGISLGIALLVGWADYSLAAASRRAALTLTQRLATMADATTFEGHWGFQYYMQEQGAVPLDRRQPRLVSNQAVVIPMNNSYLFPLPAEQVSPWFEHDEGTVKWLATMNGFCGAGFYSDGWGPLPFVAGTVLAEKFLVYRVK